MLPRRAPGRRDAGRAVTTGSNPEPNPNFSPHFRRHVQALIEGHVDIFHKNNESKTALALAQEKGLQGQWYLASVHDAKVASDFLPQYQEGTSAALATTIAKSSTASPFGKGTLEHYLSPSRPCRQLTDMSSPARCLDGSPIFSVCFR